MRVGWVFILISCAAGACSAGAQDYSFQIDQPPSGGSAQLHVSASTSGSLIGNYDAASNPAGTRTKPGFFAPGAAENVSVPVHSFNPDASGPVTLKPTGTFKVHFNAPGGALILTDFAADLLGGGSASIPISAAVSFDTFRTAAPSSTYFGIPLTLPLGDATVTALTATQVGDITGTLTPAGGKLYNFTAAPIVVIGAKITFQGSPLDVTTDPTAFPLAGQVTIDGDTASLSESAPIDFTNSSTTAVPLDPFPFDLPAGGDSAHIVLSLTLNTQDAAVQGTQTLSASGVAVPEPAGASLLLLFTLKALSRRRSF